MQIQASEEHRKLLERAAAASIREGRFYVGVEHLLGAIVEDMDLLPHSVRQHFGDALHTIARETAMTAWKGNFNAPHGEVFHTPRCIDALHRASKLAAHFGNVPGTALHLLIALLEDDCASPARVMDRIRLDRKLVLQELRKAAAQLGVGGTVAPAAAPFAEAPPQSTTGTQPAAATQAPAEQPAPSPAQAIAGMTRNLTEAARLGELSEAVGRDDEIFEVLQILARKSKNNVILVGDAGVGKTQLVEGLALKFAKEGRHAGLPPMEFLELNFSALMQGTQYRGGFEEKVNALIAHLKQSRQAVLFIDEVHLIMGAGATDGDNMDLANLLKPVLARGEIRMIGATTMQEYRRFVEKDPAIERRMQMVRLEPLSEKESIEVLRRARPGLERHHGVKISTRAMKSAVSLTQRYVPHMHLPDKALDALDQACARHRLQALRAENQGLPHTAKPNEKVLPHDIRKIVSQMAGIPLEDLTAEERRSLSGLDGWLRDRLIGQDEAIARAVTAIKKSRAGLADPNRPDSVLLFLGPTGVGKTRLAQLMAEAVFGSDDHLNPFDMSEYIEEHAVSRLLGAPPGYVGSEEEGRLTGAVRERPYSILLFDEIEKAHPRIYDIFLPIFDEGRLKDNRGRTASFRNCIIIMTSNVGAECLSRGESEDTQKELLDALRAQFRPEFINRIDQIVPFYPLVAEDVRSILRLEVNEVRKRLAPKRIGIRMYQRAYEHLGAQGYSADFGARELRRAVDQFVTAPLSEMLLEGSLNPGDLAEVLMVDSEFTVRKSQPDTAEANA